MEPNEEKQTLNLLELKPRRKLDWEPQPGDLVTLLVPRFRHPFVVRWIVPILPASRYVRVHLDPMGSLVWNLCDGNTAVLEMGEKAATKFGGDVDTWYDRIGRFLKKLERERFLEIPRP
ncbi:MAG: PqqD family protein [Candidatus Riflebacteria bacterium]|nr:PqqD family protein [Candidatus Riflebacteria bacterium]